MVLKECKKISIYPQKIQNIIKEMDTRKREEKEGSKKWKSGILYYVSITSVIQSSI
jgi:hypothetical protein